MVSLHQASISDVEREVRPFSARAALVWWDRFEKPLERLGYTLEDVLRLGRK